MEKVPKGPFDKGPAVGRLVLMERLEGAVLEEGFARFDRALGNEGIAACPSGLASLAANAALDASSIMRSAIGYSCFKSPQGLKTRWPETT